MTHLTSILGNSQRLDGGAMFGNAPRALWSQWIEPDDHGLIPLATRCLVVSEESGRVILLETGVGAFFAPELRSRFGVTESRHVLIDNLAVAGIEPDDVDVVVLSHLHFDHAGGLLQQWSDGAELSLAFPRAQVVVSAGAWERARQPHPRDRASFIPGLPELLLEHQRLEIVDSDTSTTLGPNYRFHFSQGHTPGLMLTEVSSQHGPLLFAGDLVPGRPWVHLPITMGYDRFPELLIDEKAQLLDDLERRAGRLFFTHDTEVAVARVLRDDRGRFVCDDEAAILDETAVRSGR